MENLEENIKRANKTIENADALIITAGAGIGVDSGLPDFRGDKGFWKEYPLIAKLGISFSEMANPQWFETNPKLAWAFYGHRLNMYRNTKPHRGFYQLLEVAKSKPGGYFVYTSNVDGQFQKAGFDANRIKECHGSIHHLQCMYPCTYDIWEADSTKVEIDMKKFEAHEPLPVCRSCGGMARPNILMFGDWQWLGSRSSKQGTRFDSWLEKIIANDMKTAVIEIGAGRAVPTIRLKSQQIARDKNVTLIRINPRDYTVTENHISIPLGAAEGIEHIFKGIS